MANQRSVAGFLRERLHYPAASDSLAKLDQLAGKQIARTAFHADLEEARAAIQPWMPVYFLPAAAASVTVGVHLRPGDVKAHRLAFVAADDPGEFIEVAQSLEQAVYLALLGDEGFGNGSRMLASLPASVETANRVFGADFYRPGRNGNFQSGDEPIVMNHVFGGTTSSLLNQAEMADEPAEALKLWERAIALENGCLAVFAGAARVLLEQGQRRKAAEYAGRSMDCYHHTAFEVDLDEYFELVRPLQQEFPDLFGEDATWQLQERDPRQWARRAGELSKSGQFERSDKLLNDICQGTGDYNAVLDAFRKNYTALGWDWALALCDLRG